MLAAILFAATAILAFFVGKVTRNPSRRSGIDTKNASGFDRPRDKIGQRASRPPRQWPCMISPYQSDFDSCFPPSKLYESDGYGKMDDRHLCYFGVIREG